MSVIRRELMDERTRECAGAQAAAGDHVAAECCEQHANASTTNVPAADISSQRRCGSRRLEPDRGREAVGERDATRSARVERAALEVQREAREARVARHGEAEVAGAALREPEYRRIGAD